MTAFLLSWKENNVKMLYWFLTPKPFSKSTCAHEIWYHKGQLYLPFVFSTCLTNNRGLEQSLQNHIIYLNQEKVSQIVRETRRKLEKRMSSNPTSMGYWAWMHIISSLAMIGTWWYVLSLFLFLKTKEKKMSKRDYMEIWILFNAWLFAYIWPRPVSHKLPRIFNGSQENPSFDFITRAFLNHFNCSN